MSRGSRLGVALLALLPWLAADAGTEGSPREDYVLHCSGCHQPDGAGAPGLIPALAGLHELLALPGGRAYLLAVPGVAQAPLGDARLARLLDWVVHEFSGAPPDPSFSAAEVSAGRRRPLRDPAAARVRLVAGPEAR